MNLRTTRTLTRTRGPLALAGGLVVVGVVLATLVAAPQADPVGALLPAEVSENGLEDGTLRSTTAPAPSARVRLAGRVLSSEGADGIAAQDRPIPDAPMEPTSTRDWAAHYRALGLEQLDAALPSVFGAEGVKNQRVGYLKALAEHGGPASRSGFLAAAAWPGDPDEPRGVSLASFALTQLERRAEDPEFRATLEELAWDPTLGLEPRLRGRAVACLVREVADADLLALRGRLYSELDPHVRASALGAARSRERHVREALSDLFPGTELVSWTPPTDRPRQR